MTPPYDPLNPLYVEGYQGGYPTTVTPGETELVLTSKRLQVTMQYATRHTLKTTSKRLKVELNPGTVP